MGTIGKTHGVKMAARPNPKAAARNNARPCESPAAAAPGEVVVATALGLASMYPAGAANAATFAEASTTRVAVTARFTGGRHRRSLHIW